MVNEIFIQYPIPFVSITTLVGDFSDNLKDIIIWDKKNAEPAIGESIINRRSELILVFDNEMKQGILVNVFLTSPMLFDDPMTLL